MTSLARTFVCIGAGLVCSRVGLVVGAIFLPLAFPLSLPGSSRAENNVVALLILITVVFAVGGFVLCWKLTARWVRD
jgi:flagellin-like protein